LSKPAIGFFAPSGFLEPAVMDRAAHYLAGRGWQVSAGESVFAREQRFAGPDALRLAELQRFASDPLLDVAVCARGGYGLTRLLDQIDYAAIAAAGLPVVGYSDFTAFSLALYACAGGISFQGPSAGDFAAAADSGNADAAYTMEHFFGALTEEAYAFEFALGELSPSASLGRGRLDLLGRLWGGNLAMVCSLLGTPYLPRIRGGILFLEDVNEPAYRIERLLLQLLQAGVLEQQKAIVLGDFSGVTATPRDEGYDLAAACAALRKRCPVPIISGLPFGHGRRRVTLPVGAPARITVNGERVLLQFRGYPRLRSR